MKSVGTGRASSGGRRPTARAAVRGAATPDVATGPVERGTRARVTRLVLEHGPQTAAALSEQLQLTPAAVRRHLDALVAEGVLEARAPRAYGARGRGRPARVFAVTDLGRERFEHSYDDLAVAALRHLQDTAGSDAVAGFARARAGALEQRHRAAVGAVSGSERVAVLARELSTDGYAATVTTTPAGAEQLCQHHCPVAHVAAEFPELCEAETEAIGRLLGTHVQRLATIAHGDGVCTTHVPVPPALTRKARA